MDAGAGAKTLHTCALLCALMHSLLAQPTVPLGFFPALFFSGTGEGGQDHCSGGWLSAPAAVGKFNLDSKKLEDPAHSCAATSPFWAQPWVGACMLFLS